MNSTAEVGCVLALVLGVAILFGVWVSVLEKRIQDLADQQEERWQRHMKNHPKGQA